MRQVILQALVAETLKGIFAAADAAQPARQARRGRQDAPATALAGRASAGRLAGAGIGLSGLCRSDELTWLAVALSGLGVAAYHPESARLARAASCGSQVGMGWFAMGGNVGFAAGPAFAGVVLGALGPAGTLPLAVPALMCAAVTALAMKRATWGSPAARPRAASAASTDDWGEFATLTVAVAARSIVTFGLGTFLASFVEQRLHASTTVGEAALITFYGVGAASTILGGCLAHRFGRIRTVRPATCSGFPRWQPSGWCPVRPTLLPSP